MFNHLAYARYVARHKWYVLKACRPMGVSLLRGLAHDLSKLLPSEWGPYVHCFYAPDGTKRYNETPEFNLAWCLHQKTNKHHYQAWIVVMDRGEMVPLEMPEKYVREMIADWIGAGLAITGKNEVADWYTKNYHKIKLHPRTRALVHQLLAEYGFKVEDVPAPTDMQDDFYEMLVEAGKLCRYWNNKLDDPQCQNLATHQVAWSDREMNVCEQHIDYAKSAAANDGSSDRSDNPRVEGLYQPPMVRKWWPELIKRFTVDGNGGILRKETT